MIRKIFTLALALCPVALSASPCWKTIFEWNEKDASKKERLLILPFENATALEDDAWIGYLFPVMLQDYLSLSKQTVPLMAVTAPRLALFDPARALEIGKKVGADSLIIGQFSREGAILRVATRLLDVREGTEAGRAGGAVEFPGTRTINDFLIDLSVQASHAFKNVKLTKKKLLPYRNETISAEALRFFVLGTVALKRGTEQGVEEAVKRFEESIRHDYNYVPAYLGLALSYARRGFIENTHGLPYRDSFTAARAQLEKARLLKRYMTERKTREIEIYLEAETHYRLAEGYAAPGEIKKAILEMKQATETLKGDFASRERLVAYLNQQGRAREAKKEQEIVAQLTQCRGEE